MIFFSDEHVSAIRQSIRAALEDPLGPIDHLVIIYRSEREWIERGILDEPNPRAMRDGRMNILDAIFRGVLAERIASRSRWADLNRSTDRAMEAILEHVRKWDNALAEAGAEAALPGVFGARAEDKQEALEISASRELDHVILWVLSSAGKPLRHKEIETRIKSDWNWCCGAVSQKTIANHFTSSQFLKAHTRVAAQRERTLSELGMAWIREHPAPTQR